MFPIGIDIGYETTKYAIQDSTGLFPAAVVPNTDDDPLFRSSRQYHVLIKWSDGRIVERLVGDAALRHPEIVQTRNQVKPAEDHDLLLLLAAYLAGEEGPFDVGVGLPLGYYRAQEVGLAARLRGLSATLTVDQGDSRRLQVRHVEVYPQGAIVLLSMASDLPRNGWVLLVDPGSNTTEHILCEMVDGVPNPVKKPFSDSIEDGSFKVYQAIAGAWSAKVGIPLPPDRAVDVYKKALAGEAVTYASRSYDLSPETEAAKKDVANLIARRVLAALGNRAGWVETTILIGGGTLLYGTNLTQHFVAPRIVESPVFANAAAYLAVLAGGL